MVHHLWDVNIMLIFSLSNIARVQFTTEHKKQVSNLVKYFSLYLQDLA